MQKILIFILFILISGCATNPPGQVGVPILAYQSVGDGVFRGATPREEGLLYLKSQNFKTILNLDSDEVTNQIEQKIADQHGIREIQIPLSGFFKPDDKDIDRALEVLADKSLRPIYVHCQHGHDRTGLIIGLYRTEILKWDKQTAYDEMLKLGFHKILWPLDAYFENRTRR
jgi:protein tyrosine/serine phosphatase